MEKDFTVSVMCTAHPQAATSSICTCMLLLLWGIGGGGVATTAAHFDVGN